MKRHGLYKMYSIGFILSLIFTIVAYHLVVAKVLSGEILLMTILVLAVAQLVVQLYFFLHLGSEQKPRWNLISLINTVGIIFLVVIGSIWIMNHLNNNMTPQQMNMKIIQDEGYSK